MQPDGDDESTAGKRHERIRRSAIVGLLICALAPPLFLFVSIQRSAITYPFWDHCEMIHYFNDVRADRFKVQDLFKPHNHSRPATYRAVILANALLTDWDIRSEYVYLQASILIAFLILAAALYRAVGGDRTRFALLLLPLSILSFSPVGQNNHWWSMMIQLDFTHMFIVAAFCLICAAPNRVSNNIFAAVLCWLATYTLTNGLIAFASILALVQLTSPRVWKPSRLSLFWLANIVVLLVVYLPGLPSEGSGARPGPLALAQFTFTYLGAPLSGLIRYPYQSQFDLPRRIALACATGAITFVISGFLAYRSRRVLLDGYGGRLYVTFTLFALGSAVLTAWGRAAFDDYGVANANGSRYAIFSAYLLYALIFLKADRKELIDVPRDHELRWPRIVRGVAYAAIIGCSIKAYAQSVRVYESSYVFNKMLAQAFVGDTSEHDKYIYPNPESAKYFKSSLKTLRYGPYRDRTE